MKNPDASFRLSPGIREALFSLRLFIVFNKKVLAFRDISSVETFIPQRTRKLLAVYSFLFLFFLTYVEYAYAKNRTDIGIAHVRERGERENELEKPTMPGKRLAQPIY